MKIGIGRRHWILGITCGISLCVGLGFLSNVEQVETVLHVFYWPGALAATAFGFGRDDIQGLVLYLGGNALFYSLVFVLIFRLLLGPSTQKHPKA